ncbi:MAG: ATP-dependent Clp protease proteolytic subunit [Bacteroidetes bacterium]|nr:ATP-dependent Clp protease proteolytic subunit [Bacteroidota bacterium]
MKKRQLHITAQRNGQRADVRIEGVIASWDKANAADVRTAIAGMQAQGVRDAHVYIDSEGGSVFEAKRILAMLRMLPGRITGEGGAVVASAATWLGVMLDEFRVRASTSYMVHKPLAGAEGTEDDLKSALKLIEDITKEYRAAYAKKTGKTEDEIEALWGKGDRWYTGAEAVAEGFVDGLVADRDNEDDEQDVDLFDEEAVARIAACGCPASKLPKARAAINNDEMDIKAMRAMLGMPEGATEAEVVARVNELKQANEQHAAAAVAQRKANVKAILDKAVAERKLTEAHRASFEAKFAAAYDATKAEVEALVAAPELAKETAGAKKEAQAAGRDAWTYDQWATTDLKGLQAMMKKNPDEFQRLYQAKYGKKAKLTA